MTRTLADVFYSVRYIVNQDSESRARRFANFYGKNREELIKILETFFPTTPYRTSPDHSMLMKYAQQFKSPHSWSGKTAREMAEEIGTDPVSGNAVNYVFDYRMIYRWTSQYVHPTIVALEDHVAPPSGPFVVHWTDADGRLRMETALFNVVLYVAQCLMYALSAMKLEMPEHLSREADRVLKTFIRQKPQPPLPSWLRL